MTYLEEYICEIDKAIAKKLGVKEGSFSTIAETYLKPTENGFAQAIQAGGIEFVPDSSCEFAGIHIIDRITPKKPSFKYGNWALEYQMRFIVYGSKTCNPVQAITLISEALYQKECDLTLNNIQFQKPQIAFNRFSYIGESLYSRLTEIFLCEIEYTLRLENCKCEPLWLEN